VHFHKKGRNSASFFFQGQNFLFVQFVECFLVKVNVFIAACFEKEVVSSAVPIFVTNLFDHFLDLQEVKVQVIADSAFFPLPGKTFSEQTNVHFLGTFVTELVEFFPDVCILFFISEVLGLI